MTARASAASARPASRPAAAPRIALYTHDTFGLGHVRRSLHVVRAVAGRSPDAAILLMTGSPALHALGGLPRNADYLKIPTIAVTGPEENRPPHLPLPVNEVTSLRKRLVRSTLDTFRPHVFVVDNFPLGSRKELRPALERAHELGISTVLGLRDIVDRPEVVRRTWTREGVYDVLDRLYDRILVYGHREVLDVCEAYALPHAAAAKVHYCGYVTAASPSLEPAARVRARLGVEAPFVLATVGGGGDGYPLLAGFVDAIRQLGIPAVAVTGPLMSAADRRRLRRLAEDVPSLVIEEFLADLPSCMAAAALVVTMGGYNTAAELLALRRRALVMPRNWRYGEHARGTSAGLEWEQVLRAEALQQMGVAEMIDPEKLDGAMLARQIEAAMSRPAVRAPQSLAVGGADTVADRLLDLVREGASDEQG